MRTTRGGRLPGSAGKGCSASTSGSASLKATLGRARLMRSPSSTLTAYGVRRAASGARVTVTTMGARATVRKPGSAGRMPATVPNNQATTEPSGVCASETLPPDLLRMLPSPSVGIAS